MRGVSGFTLIEVMVALVIIGLAGFALATFTIQSYRTTENLTIRGMAQNLASVTLEELSSMSASTLHSMTQSSASVDINFPADGYVQPTLEAQTAAAKDPDYLPTQKGFSTTASGTYHALCNGQFLLGEYSSLFADTATPGTVGTLSGNGAVLYNGSDLFKTGAWSSVVAVTGPAANDYSAIYGAGGTNQLALVSGDTSSYSVYRYQLGSGIYLEPMNAGTSAAPSWTAGLLVFASTAPHLYRDMTVTDVSASTAAEEYRIDVRIIWTFGGVQQVVEVTGAKAGSS
jgi:prepilin-type N-terminal cleavage/methylation domain-containing protein